MPSSSSVGVVGEGLVDLGAGDHVDQPHLDRVLGEPHGAVLLLGLPRLARAQLAEPTEERGVDLLGLVVAPFHHVGERRRAAHHGIGVAGQRRLLAGADVDALARVVLDAHQPARDLDRGAVVAGGDRELGAEHRGLAAGGTRKPRGGALHVRGTSATSAPRGRGGPRGPDQRESSTLAGGAIDREIGAVGEGEVDPGAGVGAQRGAGARTAAPAASGEHAPAPSQTSEAAALVRGGA